MARYKDANTLKRCDYADLTDIEQKEFQMFAELEADGLLRRVANTSTDFKLVIARTLFSKIS
ncbi:hypothetical protein [Hyphomicrobium sp. ghe19]|uniref:hypothetical protein n=1 Tax=Hyphomicrobium sp. ghe19 TaxID=2682968 RepID=UPI001366E5B3|nr:hypothetical protein HYPP_04384 [Hyphomicrobium sp. ghe19]